MKKRVLSLVLALVLCLGLLPATALAAEDRSGELSDGNVTYRFDGRTGTLTISGTGTMDRVTYTFTSSSGNLTFINRMLAWPWSYEEWNNEIVSVVIEEGVTGINGWGMFHGCRELTSVTFPDSLTSVKSEQMFWGCSKLTDVTLGRGLTNIPSKMFQHCSGLTSVTIPGSVTRIEKNAFEGCSGLKSVTIPGSVASIEDSAFAGCTGLKSVTIQSGVTSIEDLAFWNCTSLTDVELPNSLRTIGSAFARCTSLAGIEIPNSVTKIGNSTFSECYSLTSIEIPESVTEIGSYAFVACALTKLRIPNSVTKIGYEAFDDCRNLRQITIPASVKESGGYWFGGCSDLELIYFGGTEEQWEKLEQGYYIPVRFNSEGYEMSDFVCAREGELSQYVGPGGNVTIPSNITTIGPKAFLGCDSLTGVTIPSSVTEIGTEAFSDCSALTEVRIADGVAWIEESAFYDCSALTSINIPDSVTRIGRDAFRGCSLTSIRLPENVYIEYGAFSGAEPKELVIPAGVISEDYAFGYLKSEKLTIASDCVDMVDNDYDVGAFRCKEVVFADGATEVPWWAFKDSETLTTVTLADSVKTIASQAFYDCDKLTTVNLGNGVTTIHAGAFAECSALKEITIPPSVTTIADNAFNSYALKTIYGAPGSAAETYAKNKGIAFVAVDLKIPDPPKPKPTATGFSDVPAGIWYEFPILWAVEEKITLGTGDGMFSPLEECTQIQILTFLWRAAGRPDSSVTPAVAVTENADYAGAARWATEKRMIDGSFAPNAPCTRGTAVKFIWQALGAPKAGSASSFSDVAAGAAYAEAVSWAVEKGITMGTSDTTFEPNKTCNRSEIVTLLWRTYSN